MKWAAVRRRLTASRSHGPWWRRCTAGARPRTLFATHYHELTELEQLLPGVKNVHVSVQEAGSEIIFLRRVEPGQRGQELRHRSGAPGGVADTM